MHKRAVLPMPPEHKLAREVREAELAEVQDGLVRVLGWVRREVPRLDLVPAHLYPVQVLHAGDLRRGLRHGAGVAELFDLGLLAHVHWRGGRVEGDRDVVLFVEVHCAVAVLRAGDGFVERVGLIGGALRFMPIPEGESGNCDAEAIVAFLSRDMLRPTAPFATGSVEASSCGGQARCPRFARPRLGGGCSTRYSTRSRHSSSSSSSSSSGVDFRPWPLHVFREDKPRTDDPFVETLVEEVPVNEILGAIWVGVGVGTGRAGRGGRARNRFVADGEDLGEAFLGASSTVGSCGI
jgi:hypothetical protein